MITDTQGSLSTKLIHRGSVHVRFIVICALSWLLWLLINDDECCQLFDQLSDVLKMYPNPSPLMMYVVMNLVVIALLFNARKHPSQKKKLPVSSKVDTSPKVKFPTKVDVHEDDEPTKKNTVCKKVGIVSNSLPEVSKGSVIPSCESEMKEKATPSPDSAVTVSPVSSARNSCVKIVADISSMNPVTENVCEENLGSPQSCDELFDKAEKFIMNFYQQLQKQSQREE